MRVRQVDPPLSRRLRVRRRRFFSLRWNTNTAQRTGLQTVVPTAAPSQSLEQLIPDGRQQPRNKHIEQALISYRKAMSLAPDSVQAQLGLALSVN